MSSFGPSVEKAGNQARAWVWGGRGVRWPFPKPPAAASCALPMVEQTPVPEGTRLLGLLLSDCSLHFS